MVGKLIVVILWELLTSVMDRTSVLYHGLPLHPVNQRQPKYILMISDFLGPHPMQRRVASEPAHLDIQSPDRLSDHDIVSGTLKIVIPPIKKPRRKYIVIRRVTMNL